jgi:hypothetical protein
MHGSQEFPALIEDLAREALLRGPVTVHLELLASTEQPRIDALVAGRGSQEPPHDGMWVDPFQSGRSSAAMWKLLLDLGALARETGRLRIQAIDPGGDDARVRDRGMADAVVADVRARPGDVHIGLVGNVHSRLDHGLPWDDGMDPFARLVKASGVTVTALLGTYGGGAIWACSTPKPESCGRMPVDGNADESGATRSIHLTREPNHGGHGGVAYVGVLHESPPATGRSPQVSASAP